MVYFPHYTQGAPFPGTCKKCGNNQDLYAWSETEFDGTLLICGRCVSDLGRAIGWFDPTEMLDNNAKLQEEVRILQEQVNKVPNLVDGLIDGIRSNITDFVFAVSYSDDTNGSVDAEKLELPSKPADQHSTTAKRSSAAPIKSPIK